MINKETVGKFFIIKDLEFSDFFKDEEGKIRIFDTETEALETCGIYEFDDALVCQVTFNHIENEIEW